MANFKKLRTEFLKCLTIDSKINDRRRKEYNQAIFDKDKGWQVFNNTNLFMVMEKFDKAVIEIKSYKNNRI